MNKKLQKFEFSERVIQEAAKYQDVILGRVISQYKDLYKIATQEDDVIAEVSGKMRYEVITKTQFPVVGDYVLIDRKDQKNGNAIIHRVMERHSALSRKIVGNTHDLQVLAANMDKIFICMSLNQDFNLRRLERYMAIAWESGAIPAVVLTKRDLCEDYFQKLDEVTNIAIGLEVFITSSIEGEGIKSIKNNIKRGETAVFIGSSGVGKSTLINHLLEENVIATTEIRNDDKGRHTTTRRELFLIPSGGMVIDTPGMREIGIEGSDVSRAFTDIEQLSEKCKFKDCTHKNEPMCAVRKAVEEGFISVERFLNYEKLKKEAGYEGLNFKQIEKKKTNEMFSEFGGIKNARKIIKSKNKKN